MSMNLCITDNGRFLQWDDQTPFFYLADTAWELFHRLTLEEAKHYLDVRAEQGFTVIQAASGLEALQQDVPMVEIRNHNPMWRRMEWT